MFLGLSKYMVFFFLETSIDAIFKTIMLVIDEYCFCSKIDHI